MGSHPLSYLPLQEAMTRPDVFNTNPRSSSTMGADALA
jgi:hypothetical protein